MKLLIVSHSCATATNQRLYAELEAATGWDLTLAIPAQWKDEFGNHLDEPPCDGLKARVIKVPVLGNGNIILHCYRKVWGRFLKEEKFDAIYLNHEPYALATAQICLANDDPKTAFGFYSCQNIHKQYPFPFSSLERMVYRRSQFAFPITEAVDAVLRAKGYKGKTTICPLPLDPALYHPRSEAENHGMIPRGSGEVVIGFVGRLVESKGLGTLALALAQLADLPWKLVLIGTGAFEGGLRELLKSKGLSERVTFHGYVPHEETPKYLSAFDMLVLPSETQPNWKEQFGRVIPEALACGAAVVGSDSGEIPNLIRTSGGGLVFPERNAEAFADALRTLILNPQQRKDYANAGMKWANDHLSLRAVAQQMACTLEPFAR
jgi:glycosyltransferase involved in cell wall biosynthesis